MVFQSYALYPHMTVRENMGFSLKIAGSAAGRDRAARGRGRARSSTSANCSSGAPRSCPAASASASRWAAPSCAHPEVFLFDEPLSNLDAKLRTQMRTEIKKLHAKVQSTVIYVTHDQVEAMTLADRIVIMRDGDIEQVGTPDEVFRRPATRFVAGFIGSPPMNLVEATVDDGEIRFEDGASLPVPRQFKGAVSAGQRVVFGLRPDDIYPSGHGIHSGEEADIHQVDLPVSITEPLGNETLVFVEFTGRDWVSRMLNPKPLRSGERIGMSLDLSQAHLFAADTGSFAEELTTWQGSRKSSCGWST